MNNRLKPIMFIFVSFLSIAVFTANALCQNLDIEYVGSTLWNGVIDVEIVENYAYCTFTNGLMILDISNIASPNFVSHYYLPEGAYGIDISGNYAYVADQESGLQIIDVTDPANPFLSRKL